MSERQADIIITILLMILATLLKWEIAQCVMFGIAIMQATAALIRPNP